MQKINQNKKNLIVLFAFIIGVAALVALVSYPCYQKISDINARIYDQRVQLAILDQQRLNTEQTHADYNKIKNDFEDVQKIFINPNDMLTFFSKLETIANDNGLIQNIALSSATGNFVNNTLALTLTIEGSWANIHRYIADLETLDTYVSISSSSISRSGNIIIAVFSANVFSQTQ